MAIEIVSFPIKIVIFHSYVSLPEGSPHGVHWQPSYKLDHMPHHLLP